MRIISNKNCKWLFLIFLLCYSSFSINNAKYIKCEVPLNVSTDQVFNARIYFKNIGTTTWGLNRTPVALISQNPKCNQIWGTYFIILGQGRSIAPGDTMVFNSNLRAPSKPGTYKFSWQCINSLGGYDRIDTTKATFGDVVAGVTISVENKLVKETYKFTVMDSLLDSADLEYTGSFNVPSIPGKDLRWIESGICIRNVNNQKTILVSNKSLLYEVSIPDASKLKDSSYRNIKTASIIKVWGDVTYGIINNETINMNGTFWFDDSSGILYWCHYNDYFTGNSSAFPQLLGTKLNADGTLTHVGAWYISRTVSLFKGFWGGVTNLSKNFALKYTSGRTMAVGFGGYYSICQKASRGPAIGAISIPEVSSDQLNLLPLLCYTQEQPCIRDGNYLPVMGFWDDFPVSRKIGSWTYNDVCRAGLFIDLPDKKGFLVFGQQVVGRVGYDYGGYNTDAHFQDVWFFYNIDDLGMVAKKLMKPQDVVPTSFASIKYPFKHVERGSVTGACFDKDNRTIYLYLSASKYDRFPVIHAYRIK